MKFWHTLFSLFSVATQSGRLPEEAKLDHTINNFHAAMQGVEAKAQRITHRQKDDPRRGELRALKEQSSRQIDDLVHQQRDGPADRARQVMREMLGRMKS